MKPLFLLLCLLTLAFSNLQAQMFRGLDKSPMDMAYYPDDFAHDRKFAPQKVTQTPSSFLETAPSKTAPNPAECPKTGLPLP